MARETNAGEMEIWSLMSGAMDVNEDRFIHLAEQRAELRNSLAEARALVLEQAASTAAKQIATQRLQRVITEGRKLATFLRRGVKQEYGNRSEKLLEFGIKPLRVHRRANSPEVSAGTE